MNKIASSATSRATAILAIITVAVMLAFAALLTLPLQAQTTTVNLVSHVAGGSNNTPDNAPIFAQQFTTGSDLGYTITQVSIRLGSSGVTGRDITVRLKENNSSNEPGQLLATLTNPTTLAPDDYNIFTVPDVGTVVESNTSYWVTVNEELESPGARIKWWHANGENSPYGWTIANNALHRTIDSTDWASHTDSILMRIRGTVRTASTDATLSDLALEGATGGEAIALTPAFDADTITYTASVANRIDLVTLTATKNDDNAMVVITGDEDLNTPESAELDLVIGSNTLTVTVTAEDTTTTKTYTITVTQEKAPLVSNTEEILSGSGTNSLVAQSFKTGASVGGFTISEVQLRLVSGTDKSTSVRIRQDNNGEPATGDPVAILTNPATLTAHRLNTFTAPAGTTLAPSTTYWITTNEGIPSADRAYFQATNEDAQTGETGWSIGNGRLFRSGETDSWTTQPSSLLIAIKGTTGGYVASTDATLSDLALEDGSANEITLTPPFVTGTKSYTALVANSVSSITLTPTVNDANATVEYLDASDASITDTDTSTPALDAPLAVLDNTFKVKVTAEAGSTNTDTYTVVVTREAQAQSLTTFVTNTGGSGITDSDRFQAQSFETGTNEGGYTVSQVDILLGDVSGKSTSVSIKEDNGGEPGNLVTTLTNPGTLTSNQFNTFTAPDIITLDANTTYWLTVNEGISSDRVFVSSKPADDELSFSGWGIGDGSLHRTSEMDSWSNSTSSLMMEILGTTSTDATLSDLALEEGGGNEITLTPPFVTGTKSYTALVENSVSSITLTPTVNNANATVEYLDASDASITDTDTSTPALDAPLAVLDNTFKVKVTAEAGGTNTDTYTVVVTREAQAVDTHVLVSNTGQARKSTFAPTYRTLRNS